MKISAKIDYACRALLELSLHWLNNVPVQVNMIAQNQKIPIKFLIQILLGLKQLGYVQSIRGKRGGYLLAKAPHMISLSELIQNFGNIGYSASENRAGGDRYPKHVMDLIWAEIDGVVLKAMAQIDFEDICNRKRSRDNSFVFQI